jgi:uncharacterized protein (TIGR02246 family)
MRKSWFFVMLFTVAGLAPAGAEDVRQAIEASNNKLAAAFNAGDAAGVAERYTENALMLPPDATRVEGRAAIQDLWQGWIDAGLTNAKLSATDVGAQGDLAWEIGNFAIDVPGEDNAVVTATGNYVVVWQRGADGAWRLHVDTWNDAPPPSE